jgi:hypothetical protein
MGSIPEDHSETGFSLSSTERDGQPQFRIFAEFILGFLHSTGLQEADKLRRAPKGNSAAPDPEADAGPYDPDLRRFTLQNGQTVYVHLDGWRSKHGHKEIAVLTTRQAEEAFVGSRAQTAVIAAVTAMHFGGTEAGKLGAIDVGRLRRALAQIEEPLTKSAKEHGREIAQRMRDAAEGGQGNQRRGDRRRKPVPRAAEFVHDLQVPSLEYVLALLRYCRRDFDTLPHRYQTELILSTCKHMNEFLTSVRKLVTFVEYGTPEGLSTQPVKDRNRDVRAALLSEVAGLSHKEIGEELEIPLPPNSEIKGSHDTVRKSVERGLNLLKQLFGQDGWREQRASMIAEAERYNALSEEERIIEDMAESLRMSKEEARELRGNRRRRYADLRDELDSMPKTSDLDPPETAK